MATPLRKRGPTLRAVDPSRDRKLTEEEARAASAEVIALLRDIEPLNVRPAADYIRAMNPPLSGEAIAILAFVVGELHTRASKLQKSARQRKIAESPRPSSLVEKIRQAGVLRYAEAKDKVPELFAKHTRKQLTEAISKAKRRRKLP